MADRDALLEKFDPDVRALVKIYEKAKRDIIAQISAGSASDLESQRVRLQKLADIQALIAETTDEAVAWAARVVPGAYRDAVVMTREDLVGAGIDLGSVPNMQDVTIRTSFSGIHRGQAETLANNLVRSFEDIEVFVGRRANDAFRKAGLEAIISKELGAVEKGTTAKDRIVANLKADGISGFVDRRGREWQLDRYAEMVARTTLRESVTAASVTETLTEGFDLVEVIGESVFPDSPCIPWEGKVLSLTGATTGYPTLAEAMESGLFHPNCIHDLEPVVSEESRLPVDPETGEPEPLTTAQIARAIPIR